MGQFSWKFSDLLGFSDQYLAKRNMCPHIDVNGGEFTLLLPNGDKWTDNCYDGYGHIANPKNGILIDIFSILAFQNRQELFKAGLMDKLLVKAYCNSNYGKDLLDTQWLQDFMSPEVTDKEIFKQLLEGELNEALRYAGISLQNNDEIKNELMEYKPLKFVFNKSLHYETVEASPDDETQGESKECWIRDVLYGDDEEDD